MTENISIAPFWDTEELHSRSIGKTNVCLFLYIIVNLRSFYEAFTFYLNNLVKVVRCLGFAKCFKIFYVNWNFWKFNYFSAFWYMSPLKRYATSIMAFFNLFSCVTLCQFYSFMFPILLTKNNKLRNETKKICGWSSYYVTWPPRLKLTLPWWGGFPPRSFKPSASTRRAQLSVAAKVVRPTNLLKNVRYWFTID